MYLDQVTWPDETHRWFTLCVNISFSTLIHCTFNLCCHLTTSHLNSSHNGWPPDHGHSHPPSSSPWWMGLEICRVSSLRDDSGDKNGLIDVSNHRQNNNDNVGFFLFFTIITSTISTHPPPLPRPSRRILCHRRVKPPPKRRQQRMFFFLYFFIYTLLIITYKDYMRVRTGTMTTTDDEEQWEVKNPMYVFIIFFFF